MSYTLNELLWRHRRDFEDFDIRDFQQSNLFFYAEMKEIMDQPTRDEQFEKMCFIVKYQKPQTVEVRRAFLDSLHIDYDWIAEKMEATMHREEGTGDDAIEEFRSALNGSDIPTVGDLFVYRLGHLWDLQTKIKKLKRKEYLILYSKVGFGKKWLVKNACSDYSVFEAMKNKVYWINLGNCGTDEQIYEKLFKLRIMLTKYDDFDIKLPVIDSELIEHKIENLKRYLIRILESDSYRDSLLILCGVNENEKAFRAFDLQCKILITTKNKAVFDEIPAERKTEVNIKSGFTKDECLQLFEKATRGKVLKHEFPEEAHDIIETTLGHPFIIASIAKSLFEYDERLFLRSDVNKALADWLKRGKNNSFEDEAQEQVMNNIRTSYEKLTENQQKLYRQLYVFKDDANIPYQVLELYWRKTENEVVKVVNEFYRKSLVEKSFIVSRGWGPGSSNSIDPRDQKRFKTCSLHFLYYSFLRSLLNPNEICEMHKSLMEAYSVQELASGANARTFELADDYYFYYYVGYHLEAAKMEDLMPKLFLDIEFLEAKMRATGLPNTIGDLDMYGRHIVENSKRMMDAKSLLDNLIDFLPTVEEFLLCSPSTCLLQYAFNSTIPTIREAAKRQMRQYRSRVWFQDSDHSHKYRQIVQLPEAPVAVKFLNHPDGALLALKDNSILLKDLSPSYSAENTTYTFHKAQVKSLVLLNDEAFTSLDHDGVIALWSLKSTAVSKRLSNSRRTSEIETPQKLTAKQIYGPFDQTDFANGKKLMSLTPHFNCMSAVKRSTDETILIAGDNGGVVWFYDYDRFQRRLINNKVAKIRTRATREGSAPITALLLFTIELHSYVVVLHADGMLTFYDTATSGEVPTEKGWESIEGPINIHHVCSNYNKSDHFLICVFERVVLKVGITVNRRSRIDCSETVLHDVRGNGKITCSVISDDVDYPYLILGTEHGIKIIDIQKEVELPCKNFNDQIASIDICSLADDNYRHIIISCAKKSGNWVALQATVTKDSGLGWENDRTESPIHIEDLSDRSHMNKSLQGQKRFEVLVCTDSEISIVVPDTRNRIQLRSSKTGFKPEFCTDSFESPISAVSCGFENSLVGCEDGKVFKVLTSPVPIVERIDDVCDKVTYLKYCKNKMIVIGAANRYQIHGQKTEYPRAIGTCIEVGDWVLVISQDCQIDIFDEQKKWKHTCSELKDEKFCAAATANASYGSSNKWIVMIGTANNHVHSYSLPFRADKNSFSDINTDYLLRNVTISSLAISPKASVWAVGYTNGAISIYKMTNGDPETSKILQRVESGTDRIEDLLFSPWKDPSSPVILVSLSREAAFWDVKHMINNPYPDRSSPKQLSQRFKKRSQISPLRMDVSENETLGFQPIENCWSEKRGPNERPELLACIRLIGKAEKIVASPDFSEFVTLDNEGEIYHLRVYEEKLA